MNAMLYAAWLSALLVLLSPLSHGIEEVKPQHDGKLDTVDVLQNGSVQVSGTYEAVDINKSAAQAMPDKEELQDLLHWAISEYFHACRALVGGIHVNNVTRSGVWWRMIYPSLFAYRAQRSQGPEGGCQWQGTSGRRRAQERGGGGDSPCLSFCPSWSILIDLICLISQRMHAPLHVCAVGRRLST